MSRNLVFHTSFFSRCFNSHLNIAFRGICSSKSPTPGNAGLPKAQKMSQAMRVYLERSQSHNAMMKEEIAEFETGRKYLANMMGLDPETITQEEIDEAIEYLLPSGLFDKKARPKMKHPLEILPKRKAAQFGLDGCPFNTFFYTSKQNFAELLHNISMKIEECKVLEDKNHSKQSAPSNLIELKGSEWLDLDKINEIIEEKLLEPEYKTLIMSLEHLVRMPFSNVHKDFVMKYRYNLQQQNTFTLFQKKEALKDENGRLYYEDTGKRKKGRSTVKLFEKGNGNFTVNNLPLIEFFPNLSEREQVLFPLHLVDQLGKVDVEVEVHDGGPSGKAGATRLAIARCLQNIISEEERKKLKIAGLLTSDPRLLERQKPGKSGARRSYTWKKR